MGISERESREMREGFDARGQLSDLAPLVSDLVREQADAVTEHIDENKGILSPDFAVQSWYIVLAALNTEARLRKAEKRGQRTAKIVEDRKATG
jgi:hypothetical protein